MLEKHPTGPTNIQNIFFRCGNNQNLTFLSSKMANYSDQLPIFYHQMLRWQLKPVHHSQSLSSVRNYVPQNFAKHNYQNMKSIMPFDTIFVTNLRDPVSLAAFGRSYNNPQVLRPETLVAHAESAFVFSRNRPGNNTALNRRIYQRFGPNQMSFDLGLDVQRSYNLEEIQKFIQTIDSQFHLIMLDDRKEESLVHLQHLLCWTSDDMSVFRQNFRSILSPQNVSIDLQQTIRSINNVDELLYKHFSDKLTRQTEVFGKAKMDEQIASLQQDIKLRYDQCVKKLGDGQTFNSSNLTLDDYRYLRQKINTSEDRKCHELIMSQLLNAKLVGKN